MFNIFNNPSTIASSFKKKPQDLYSGSILSIYEPQTGAPRSYMGQSITGSTKAPQSYPMPKTTTPAPKPPPVVPPPTQKIQPSATEAYQQKYQEYLRQSQARQEEQARLQRDEDTRTANENYNLTNQGLQATLANVGSQIGGVRERSAASSARLKTVADQNKANARVESGENQRQLMQTRRQQLADQEKRYAALGTIDSYGTGSFQSANENVENDFLRTTAKNKRVAEQQLADIDNKLFDAQANVEAQLSTEESKYNDAVLQINQLLAGNEVEKNQLLRQAAMKFSNAKSTILDQYEQLRITSEKEKVDAQMKLEEAGQADQKLMEVMQSASPEFLKTGVPKTAQDQFIIFKYPKEAEAYVKMLGQGSGDATDLRKEFAGRVGNINYQTIISNVKKIQGAPDNAAGDMGMIFAYMKLLDPNSTVREGEYATAQNATGVPQAVLNQYNSVLQGRRLNPTQREQFTSAGVAYAQPTIDQFNQAQQYYSGLAEKSKLNPNDVTGGFMGMGDTGSNTSGQVKMVDPIGRSYTVDASEVAEATQNGWKLAQ